jgi:hypothetical protein
MTVCKGLYKKRRQRLQQSCCEHQRLPLPITYFVSSIHETKLSTKESASNLLGTFFNTSRLKPDASQSIIAFGNDKTLMTDTPSLPDVNTTRIYIYTPNLPRRYILVLLKGFDIFCWRNDDRELFTVQQTTQINSTAGVRGKKLNITACSFDNIDICRILERNCIRHEADEDKTMKDDYGRFVKRNK